MGLKYRLFIHNPNKRNISKGVKKGRKSKEMTSFLPLFIDFQHFLTLFGLEYGFLKTEEFPRAMFRPFLSIFGVKSIKLNEIRQKLLISDVNGPCSDVSFLFFK